VRGRFGVQPRDRPDAVGVVVAVGVAVVEVGVGQTVKVEIRKIGKQQGHWDCHLDLAEGAAGLVEGVVDERCWQ